MKLFSTLSTLLLACTSVSARPLEERQNGILYLQAKTNVAQRLEIRQLRDTQPAQYNLFVVSLNRMMAKDRRDPSSYYALASIHGVGRSANNGNLFGFNKCGNCQADGYAVHDSVLFPTWHRAYMGLFEQELTKVAKQVAAEYPSAQKATYQKAANALRLPYYDSAARPKQGSPALPNLMTDTTVVVNGPKGRTSTPNPLWRFKLGDPSAMTYQYFTAWDRTLRYPDSNAQNAKSRQDLAHNALSNLRQSLADQFYGLFTNCHDWLHFSNDRAGNSVPGCATSMEDIHNGIHNAIGGVGNGQGLSGGHMTYLPLSSFDPSFWLHHSNIDRIFAMWQTLNPNQWGTSQSTPTSSWTIPQGQVVDANSPLTPFTRQQGGDWTSNALRNWRNLGYTYPEYKNGGSAQQITQYVNNLYGPNANAVAGSSKRDLLGDITGSVSQAVDNTVGATTQAATQAVDDTAGAATSQTPEADSNPISDITNAVGGIINDTVGGLTSTAQGLAEDLLKIKPDSALAANNGSVYQYVANIFTPRYTLNGTYQVYLFNGQPTTADSTQYIFEQNLVGMMGVLSKPGMTDNPLVASGSIPLTRTLQAVAGLNGTQELPSLSEDDVVPYLTKNLVWKVNGPNGAVDPATIENFVVSVYASTAPQVAEDQLPIWSEFVPLLDVTKDQAGGANTTQQLTPAEPILAVLNALPSYSS